MPVAFETLDEFAALRPTLSDGLCRLAAAPYSLGKADSNAYEHFTVPSAAGQYAAIFDRLVR